MKFSGIAHIIEKAGKKYSHEGEFQCDDDLEYRLIQGEGELYCRNMNVSNLSFVGEYEGETIFAEHIELFGRSNVCSICAISSIVIEFSSASKITKVSCENIKAFPEKQDAYASNEFINALLGFKSTKARKLPVMKFDEIIAHDVSLENCTIGTIHCYSAKLRNCIVENLFYETEYQIEGNTSITKQSKMHFTAKGRE